MKNCLIIFICLIASINILAQHDGFKPGTSTNKFMKTLEAELVEGVLQFELNNMWIYFDDTERFDSKHVIIDTSYFKDSIEYKRLFSLYRSGKDTSLIRLREDGYYVCRRKTPYPQPNNEQIYFKKNAVMGDKWKQPMPGAPPSFSILYEITSAFPWIVFGQYDTVKVLKIQDSTGLWEVTQIWSEKFGMIEMQFYMSVFDLRGCIVNGVVYGDTAMSIEETPNDLIDNKDFQLLQNFPNPFNPTTFIKYKLRERSYVILKVYNVRGEEITTLVKDEQLPGEYKIGFDADQYKLTSGVYFYKLTIGGKSEVKKMILLR